MRVGYGGWPERGINGMPTLASNIGWLEGGSIPKAVAAIAAAAGRGAAHLTSGQVRRSAEHHVCAYRSLG